MTNQVTSKACTLKGIASTLSFSFILNQLAEQKSTDLPSQTTVKGSSLSIHLNFNFIVAFIAVLRLDVRSLLHLNGTKVIGSASL